MSARPMFKQCTHCHRTYTYNPSVGDFGTVCKHCHRIQIINLPGNKPVGKK